MLRTLNPAQNLNTFTNRINDTLSTINIDKKKSGTSGHFKLFNGEVLPTKSTLVQAKLTQMITDSHRVPEEERSINSTDLRGTGRNH
jgi:hypothetical protein